jgi:hypothetical protein
MNTKTLLLYVLFITVGGCGDGPRLVKVTGKLTYKGQPVPSTDVYFVPDDGERRSHGVTDDDGKFTLKYSKREVGVSRGKHTVYLKYDVSNDEYNGVIKPKASKELKALIEKYGDVKTSGLHFEVTKDGQSIDIELTDR